MAFPPVVKISYKFTGIRLFSLFYTELGKANLNDYISLNISRIIT